MHLWNGTPAVDEYAGLSRLPNFVHDIRSAECVFCPYGARVRVGEQVIAWDDRTLFDRMPRERIVEVTAVRQFRSNGRLATLDTTVASDAELARIAVDSETTVEALMNHRKGRPTYNGRRRPVVVYFQPCNPGAGKLQFIPDLDVCAREPLPGGRTGQLWMRLKQWLHGWVWQSV